MALMRLFTGLDLPEDVVANLERLLAKLRPAARIGWSAPANLHITTKFIGEWPDERLEELTQALAPVEARAAIEVAIRKVGFFPNARAPRIFWCGVEAPGLAQLAADTDAATERLGIEPEKRAYSPHLTLARIKDRQDSGGLAKAVQALAEEEFGRFPASRFFLYRSRLQPGGSVYTKLAEFPFST
jgi:2'-5' RNA ligase